MKKFLIVLFCILGFGAIATLCYFFGYNYKSQDIEGKYYLMKVIQTDATDEDNPIETTTEVYDEENPTNYVELFKDKKLKSFLEGYLDFENDLTYDYVNKGTNLEIKNGNKILYGGYYAEGQFVLIIDDTEENNMFYEYYFEKK